MLNDTTSSKILSPCCSYWVIRTESRFVYTVCTVVVTILGANRSFQRHRTSTKGPYSFDFGDLVKSESTKICVKQVYSRFKMAQSVSRKNTDSDGRVTQSVNFSLSIKRAELTFKISPNEVEGFSIEKIAHMVPRHTLQETEITTKHFSDRSSELGAKLSVKASKKPKLNANLNGGADRSNSHKTKRKVTLQRTTSSEIGTFDNTEAHWEIKPNVDDGDGKHKEHISGEIFLANDQDQRLSALIASWKKGSGVYIELCASVRVQLKDLNISDVRIFDEHGEELSRPINAGFLERGEDVKLKFVKQLIKRHLVDLGLENSAGSIEVCIAYA